MSVTLTFLADMPAGAQVDAFMVVGGFFVPVDTASVTPSLSATFNRVSAGSGLKFAFAATHGGTPIWRSGPVDPTTENQFFVFNPKSVDGMGGGPPNLPASQFPGLAPTVPFTSGDVTVKTITGITPGNGSVTVTGTGTYHKIVSVDVAFAYTFGLSPAGQEPDVAHLVDVQTINLSLTGNNPSWFGWLINFIVDALLGVFQPNTGNLQSAVQSLLNATITKRLNTKSPVPGVTAAVQSVTITPTGGLTLEAWAGVPASSVCAGSASGGSVKLRAVAEIQRLQEIRDRMLLRHPEGYGYVALLDRHRGDLMRLFVEHQEILAEVDAVVNRVLGEFPSGNPEAGVLSAETGVAVEALLERIHSVAPPELALAIRNVRGEVRRFVGQPAETVLAASTLEFHRLGGGWAGAPGE